MASRAVARQFRPSRGLSRQIRTKAASGWAAETISYQREPLLYTPGPLTTSASVKHAMLADLGSRDARMVTVIKEIRERLLHMAGTDKSKGWDCVLMQGSGTFVVESVINSAVPGPEKGGRLLVLSNGAYGLRMAKMAEMYGIKVDIIQYGETDAVNPADVTAAMKKEKYTHVGCIHHETTAGTLNPIEKIGQAIKEADPEAQFFVDSMSGFGAYDVDLEKANVSFLVSSANKNIEGIPGFGFALARTSCLEAATHARSLSLDLRAQWKGLEANGQFRFTPPCHSLIAFRQALAEHEAEGGQSGRRARYEANFQTLKAGMAAMGFHPYLDEGVQGCIITTFLYPDDPKFDFPRFYKELSDRGLVIYPGKLTKADCFRLGTIGRLYPHDFQALLLAVKEVLTNMGVSLPVRQALTESDKIATG
eukprot:Hpha_TRINITY_DN15772_c1_g5::TRINITY_DN15772_c1_g5_i1::g.41166::m.41166/K03430/phnW; 2-aminoethylphosphonate-pyruvate transaminase